MLSLEESGQSAHEISLYYVLQLYGIYNNIKIEILIKKKSLKESDHSIIHKQLIRMWCLNCQMSSMWWALRLPKLTHDFVHHVDQNGKF